MNNNTYKPEKKFMDRAIELSVQAGLKEKSGGAFGAVIVLDNKIIGEGYNQVIKKNDPTWHGGVEAIRKACQCLKTPHLDGAIMYTSAEPCPMCYAAACWAHIDHIFYGATIGDTTELGDFTDGDYYQQLALPNGDEQKRIQLTEFMHEEALKIWQQFNQIEGRVHY